MSYPELASVMKKELDSDAHQLQIQSEPTGLQIRALMRKDGITEDYSDFSAVVDKINLFCSVTKSAEREPHSR